MEAAAAKGREGKNSHNMQPGRAWKPRPFPSITQSTLSFRASQPIRGRDLNKPRLVQGLQRLSLRGGRGEGGAGGSVWSLLGGAVGLQCLAVGRQP